MDRQCVICLDPANVRLVVKQAHRKSPITRFACFEHVGRWVRTVVGPDAPTITITNLA